MLIRFLLCLSLEPLSDPQNLILPHFSLNVIKEYTFSYQKYFVTLETVLVLIISNDG